MKTITIKDVKKWEAKTKKNYDMLEKKIIRDKGIFDCEEALEEVACREGKLYGYIEAYKDLGLIREKDYWKLYTMI